MSPSQTPVATVQNLYAAFGRGDIPAILAAFRENSEWRVNVDPRAPGASAIPLLAPRRGPQAIGEFFAQLASSTELHAFQPRSFLSGGHEVAVHIEMEFTVRATGRRTRMETMHHWTFDAAGKVTRFTDFIDTLGQAAAWEKVRAAEPAQPAAAR